MEQWYDIISILRVWSFPIRFLFECLTKFNRWPACRAWTFHLDFNPKCFQSIRSWSSFLSARANNHPAKVGDWFSGFAFHSWPPYFLTLHAISRSKCLPSPMTSDLHSDLTSGCVALSKASSVFRISPRRQTIRCFFLRPILTKLKG